MYMGYIVIYCLIKYLESSLQANKHVQSNCNRSYISVLFVCVEVLRPSQPNGVMLSASVYLTTRLLGRLSLLSG